MVIKPITSSIADQNISGGSHHRLLPDLFVYSGCVGLHYTDSYNEYLKLKAVEDDL